MYSCKRAQFGYPRRGHRDPVVRRQGQVLGDHPHRHRVGGHLRAREAQVPPHLGLLSVKVVGHEPASRQHRAVGTRPAEFQHHGLPVGVAMQDAVAGDRARGGDHHQRVAGVGFRQLVPRRGQPALLLRTAGVAARQRNPVGVEAVGQRHRRAVDAGRFQLGRRVPVVVGTGLRHDVSRIASARVRSGTPLGVNPVGLTPPSGAQRPVIVRLPRFDRRHEPCVAVRLDEHVVGQTAASAELAQVVPGIGVGGVLTDDAGHHRADEHQRHEAGRQRDRRRRQRPRQPALARGWCPRSAARPRRPRQSRTGRKRLC